MFRFFLVVSLFPVHGIYRDLHIYHGYPWYQGNNQQKTVIFRFMLDEKKVYKSTLVYPFGILMG